MKTRIYIGTPSGPVQVERIWREEGIAESMVCLKRTTEKLPIGAGYDDFVKRPSGIIEREFGPFEAGAFRLDLSNSINQGKSWQLAVFAAHALAREGLLAGPDEPFERAIWLTGQVDNDLKLGGVTQVPEKIHGALPELGALAKAGKEVLLYVPRENAQALASANLPPEIEGRAVASATEILDTIGTALTHRVAATEAMMVGGTADRPADRHRRKRAVLGLTFLVLGAAAVAAGVILPGGLIPDETISSATEADQKTPAADRAEPAPEPEAPGAATSPVIAEATLQIEPASPAEPSLATIEAEPDISIFEVRPPIAGGCPAVHFGADGGVTTKLESASAGEYISNAAAGLCAIEFRLAAAPGQPYMVAVIELISGRYVESESTPASLRGGQATDGPVAWRINLPLRIKGPLEYRIYVVSSEGEIAGEAYRSFKERDFTAANQSGLPIKTAHHTVLP